MKSPFGIEYRGLMPASTSQNESLDDDCGHDGWQAGCPKCESEHDLALTLISDHEALD